MSSCPFDNEILNAKLRWKVLLPFERDKHGRKKKKRNSNQYVMFNYSLECLKANIFLTDSLLSSPKT